MRALSGKRRLAKDRCARSVGAHRAVKQMPVCLVLCCVERPILLF